MRRYFGGAIGGSGGIRRRLSNDSLAPLTLMVAFFVGGICWAFSEVRTGHRTWVAGIMLGVENAASARGESARVASYLLGNGRLGIIET